MWESRTGADETGGGERRKGPVHWRRALARPPLRRPRFPHRPGRDRPPSADRRRREAPGRRRPRHSPSTSRAPSAWSDVFRSQALEAKWALPGPRGSVPGDGPPDGRLYEALQRMRRPPAGAARGARRAADASVGEIGRWRSSYRAKGIGRSLRGIMIVLPGLRSRPPGILLPHARPFAPPPCGQTAADGRAGSGRLAGPGGRGPGGKGRVGQARRGPL